MQMIKESKEKSYYAANDHSKPPLTKENIQSLLEMP